MIFIVAAVVVIPLAILLYFLSVQSRKSYHCPSCGERLTVEHMTAHHCGMCGTPLQETFNES